jgi:hypothetical protein
METGKANNIQAKNFNIGHSEHYHLSVQIGLKQLAYCIINNSTNNIEYLNKLKINDNFINLINKDKVLQLNFASSSVAFANFPSTLIPNELFHSDNLEDFLELNTDIYDIIKSDQISEIEANLAYTIPSVINDIISTFFPNAKQNALQTILIKKFSRFDNKKKHSYLYLNEKHLSITVFKKGKLIFNNDFVYDSKEDILYYTLFVFEQLKIDTETVNVKLYGEITKGDENHQILYEYIRNIDFGERPKNLNFPSEFSGIQQHQFHELFSQYK